MTCLIPNIFSEQQIWITDESLEYYRVNSVTTRSYPSLVGMLPIHRFRSKPNKYGKNPLMRIEPKTYCSQSLITPLRYYYTIKPWTCLIHSYSK
ncbi:hypothetical protein Hanom_Chr16g01444881 [Helianthus anomalus]